jgi:hypothetical protein
MVERQNLKFIAEASLNLVEDIAIQNRNEDMASHYYLKGKIFKRQSLTKKHIDSLGFFAAFGFSFLNMPLLTTYFGSTISYAALTTTFLGGIFSLAEKNVLNSVELIKNGPHEGKFRIVVSEGLLSSRNLIATSDSMTGFFPNKAEDSRSSFSSLYLTEAVDEHSGEKVENMALEISNESYQDAQTFEWILSQKSGQSEIEGEFSDLMMSIHEGKSVTGGISPLSFMVRQSSNLKSLAEQRTQALLEANTSEVDVVLEEMKEKLGEEVVGKMSP